jgi:myo-inositol-1(or 4)-monophosphatase
MSASEPDWLAVCQEAFEAVRAAIAGVGDRAAELGVGEGGDTTLAVDRAAEDAVLALLGERGLPLTVITEERGEVELNGGGGEVVILDPVDGSLNAKRGLPFHALSVAVAAGRTMDTVSFGFVGDLHGGSQWWARRGAGAHSDGRRLDPLADGPLEVLGLETARPARVAAAAEMLRDLEARRLRSLGSVALSLCLVADGRFDAMLTLREVRSVDVAAGQLIVSEAGGAVAFPEAGPGADLSLAMRTRVVAARSQVLAERLGGA